MYHVLCPFVNLFLPGERHLIFQLGLPVKILAIAEVLTQISPTHLQSFPNLNHKAYGTHL